MSVRAQPILAVRDVRASARWYARILGSAEPLGSPPSDHDHVYRRIYVGDQLVLQLHAQALAERARYAASAVVCNRLA